MMANRRDGVEREKRPGWSAINDDRGKLPHGDHAVMTTMNIVGTNEVTS